MSLQAAMYFLLWAGAFALMMRFGCGAHVMGHRHRQQESTDKPDPDAAGNVTANAPEQDRDPVCGMTVSTADAKSAMNAGRAYYFCSQSCREKFEADPAKYVTPAPGVTHLKERHDGSDC